MRLTNITPEKVEEIYNKGYDLNILCFLDMINSGFYEFLHPKLLILEQTCKRKKLISDDNKLTEEGKNLLSFVSVIGEEVPKLTRKKRVPKPEVKPDDNFIKWWKAYPASDTFEYKGRKFKGTRALKTKKDECRVKLDKILLSGEYTIDELVLALQLEISQKAEASYKTNINKMSYFQNSLTYLNQGTYDSFVELVRAGHKPEEEKKQSVTGNETFI
jgi:hypothetical protein